MKKWEYQGGSPILHFEKNVRYLICRVGLVQTSLGNPPMARWNARKMEICIKDMIDDQIMKRGPLCGNFVVSGGVQIQIRNRQNGFDIFYSFVMAVRKELGYQVPFLPCQLNRQINGMNDDCWGMVRDAQAKAPEILAYLF